MDWEEMANCKQCIFYGTNYSKCAAKKMWWALEILKKEFFASFRIDYPLKNAECDFFIESWVKETEKDQKKPPPMKTCGKMRDYAGKTVL